MSVMGIVIALAALVLGAMLGWLLRAGALAAARERAAVTEARAVAADERAAELPPLRMMVNGLRDERDAAARDLAAVRAVASRVGDLEAALAAEQARASGLAAEKAGFQRGEAERAQAHAAQIEQLREMGAQIGRASCRERVSSVV